MVAPSAHDTEAGQKDESQEQHFVNSSHPSAACHLKFACSITSADYTRHKI